MKHCRDRSDRSTTQKGKYHDKSKKDTRQEEPLITVKFQLRNQTELEKELLDYYKNAYQFKQKVKSDIKQFSSNQVKIDKIWGQWIIRNLTKQKKIYSPLPNSNDCKSDNYVIKHMCDEGCENEQKAKDLYYSWLNFLENLEKGKQLSLKVFNSNELKDELDANYSIEERQIDELDNNKVIKIRLPQSLFNKLQFIYKGDLAYKKYYLFEISFCHDILDFVVKQYCIPPKVMNFLYEELQVKHELFASPLNSFFKNYCSIFQVDRMFGSYGNFYARKEEGVKICGNCQANPPHIEQVYNDSAEDIVQWIQEMDKQNEELLIVYFLPWKDCKGYINLQKAKEYVLYENVLNEFKHFEYTIQGKYFTLMRIKTYIIVMATKKSQEIWKDKIEIYMKQLVRISENPKNYQGDEYLI